MRRFIVPLVLALVLLAMTFVVIQAARGQGPDGPGQPPVATRETQGENVREIYAPAQINAPQQPNISFIDSPTVTCYQPDPAQDTCYLNWYYMSVNASPNYMISMTVILNSIGPVAQVGGFFQTSMYVPYNMLDHGFKVPCGTLGAGGNPLMGNAYAWTIRARDSSNLSSANYGTAYCPAYTP
jgi:hypothetical protein